MKRRLFKTLAAVLAIAAAAAGPVRGQNGNPDVTLDFTDNTSWGIPEGTEGKTAVENSYTSGGYTITLCGSSGNGYYFSLTEPYILLGKQGAYLQLPAFSSAVDSIHVVGTSVASTNVEQNIYVGDVAVSTVTTGMKNVTQKYVINEDYRTAGTIYRIKVTSAHNTQIKKVLVYFAHTPVPITVRMAEGTEDAANWSIASGNASVPGTQVLENVMSGSQVTATYNGTTKKVKSVKAVKYVAPPTPLDNTTTAWTAGTFAVPEGGLTYSDAITVSGDVTLTLTDGTTLTLNKGISLAEGATLTIQGNGTMNVNGTNNSTASTVAGSTGTLILTSGTLTARGGNGGSVGDFNDHSHGGNGGNAINGSVIVSGGTLTARGGNGGSVGEASDDCSGGNGGDAISGTLTINGGSTSVNNGSNGSIGEDCEDCTAGTGGKAVAGTVTDNR